MFLEIKAKLKRASKSDLFGGDLNKPGATQYIKANQTIFYRSKITNKIEGPYYLSNSQCFVDLFYKQSIGMIGILVFDGQSTPNEIPFSLVLRLANLNDFLTITDEFKYGKMYFINSNNNLNGPHYIGEDSLLSTLAKYIQAETLYVINERQHFKLK